MVTWHLKKLPVEISGSSVCFVENFGLRDADMRLKATYFFSD